MTEHPLSDEEDALITCWCGATGTYKEMFDTDCLRTDCGGLRILRCICGGDFCICHNHGEVECPGCEDCEGADGMDDYDYEEDE